MRRCSWSQAEICADVATGFEHYRSDVGDCLISSFYVLRDPLLGNLVDIASQQLAQLLHISSNSSSPLRPLEATFFCILSIQEAVPEDEDTHLAQLFGGKFFPVLASMNGLRYARLQRTALRLIREYLT